ncbi:HlyD family type I secretion periplasmic adaptor subunit [Hahella aquimaris]|uniref:HlyD family type I secretion periplasmic adaptor subunit n=1 Tax=Hahella sp. HNIBRBA332 TaxID=3015983 RepID=UPI00273B769A|nr:HlyD family type I secretion periplasmic adaptor subunit [Hahella sp. HNIBRBA332]WLQ13886.1 HlyD family type I secretion periplasmic adaptor subunit [Hahella sp. HNIBRBA332]
MSQAQPQPQKKEILSQQEILEFLPAAIEIEQTPASPLGRAILWAIVLLFCIAVVWACFGKIDIVAVTQGKVIPSERVKTIQPLETAVISKIHVSDGQLVKAGDLLITLDGAQAEADLRRLEGEWRESAAQAQRYKAMADWLQQERKGVPVMQEDEALPAILQQQHRNLLQQEAAEFTARLNALEREATRLNAEHDMTVAEITKQNRILEVLRERVNALDIMQNRKLGSRVQYLELKQELIEVEQDLAVQQARLKQLGASLAANQAQQETLMHEQYKNTLAQWREADTRAASLQEERIKAEQRSRQTRLSAPLDGTVQQLAVHTVGGVVTPAQELMLIVPEHSEMEVEALVLNKDIGFVQEGQSAEVKVDTFNFTKYGIIDAELVDLSDDAIQDENLGLVYKARLKLKQDGLTVENKYVRLSPGMSVTSEIKTGQRRLIEYFLSPLLRYKQESLGER